MSITATIANSAWWTASIPACRRYKRALFRPAETQECILQRLLTRNAESAYGQAFGFGGIHTYDQFCARVPVVEYDDLQPWIARIMRGESSVLTTEKVIRLLPTSGSTGGRKLIPFTASLQWEFNAAISPWIADLFTQHPSLLSGTAYWSISPMIPESAEEQSAVPIGFEDDSDYLGGIRRRLVETTFAAPPSLRSVADFECFRYLTLLCLLRRSDLSLASVWHPSFLTLLFDPLPIWWEELLDDIQTGCCRRALGLSPKIQNAIRVRPMPARAHELRRIGFQNFNAMWPRLKLVSCWGDGQAMPALSDLQKRLPKTEMQSKGLLATEAFISIPFQGLHPLAVTSHFFEFISENGEMCLAHELRADGIYSVVVTTGGGLWRYRLGDSVQVDGFMGAVPSLRFIGREGNVSDLCGEKLTESFVAQAMERVRISHGFSPRFAMLAPTTDLAKCRGYTLFVEGELPAGFVSGLDAELRQNPHYALCLDLGQLKPLRGFQINHGGYAAFVDACTAKGRKIGDIKPQALSPDNKWEKIFMGEYI